MFPASIRGGDDGFTLLELIVVLAIIALMLVAAPAVYAKLIPSYQVRQFANDLANAGRSLRAEARSTGSVQTITINENLNYVTINGAPLNKPDVAAVTFEPAAAYGTGPENQIHFFSNGASSGGTVTVAYENLDLKVAFDWVSGSIEVQQ